jgi:hypothetical protein
MRWIVGVATLLFLGSCSRAGSEAEKSYEIASRQGNAADKCAAAEAVAATYLKAGDEAGYDKWRKTSSEDCAIARLSAGSANGDLTVEQRRQFDAEDDASFNSFAAELNAY